MSLKDSYGNIILAFRNLSYMGELSKKHAMEMAAKGDKEHIEKMEEMKNNYMTKPEAVKEWFEKVQKEFDALPEDK